MAYKIEASGSKIAFLDKKGQAHAWMWNPSIRKHGWVKLGSPPDVKFTDVTIGNGDVWGLDADGKIYQHDPATNTWKKDPLGNLVSISGDQSGNLWGVNGSGQVFQLTKRSDGTVKLGTWEEREKPEEASTWLYVVKSRDTLLSIVRAYYDKDEASNARIVDQIAALNPGKVRGVNKVITARDILTMPPM